ncbi:hypothetical protein BDP27DRAFT_1420480 [Rhodocollybia butyracea]|uniref:Uncharacterized protein n=1 Tax=Rhodocollybia butyracea TaxID=206335 RepID=A0A9P5PVG3_9AGAR|nr:hypothetical protein BDP27DRAFT_1420480 [Rhodocollybia butyracea]
MFGNCGPMASSYLSRHVRIGLINSHLNSHITFKCTKQSFWSLAHSRSNFRPSGGFALYKTHNTLPIRLSELETVAGIGGALAYRVYYELSLRWPGYQLRNLDESEFPSVDWDNPFEALSYLRDLNHVCFRYWDQMQPTFTLSQEAKEKAQKVIRLNSLFLDLSREDLEQIVKQTINDLQEEETDSIVSTLVTLQCQMHKTMKEAPHQVHGLLDHPPRWESRTLGYDLRQIATVVLETNYALL